jgi:hypothetical protein
MDSAHWQTELFPVADRIEELATFKRFSERQANEFEREVMLAIFSVRTLIERHKLGQELLGEQIPVRAYRKKTQKPTTWLNNHKIDELFDLDAPQSKTLPLPFFCNQIIHSYILLPVQDGRQFSHLLFCSDHERNRFLYFVPVAPLIELLRKVAFDCPARTHLEFNASKQDFDITNYTNAEPPAPPKGGPAMPSGNSGGSGGSRHQ